MEIEVGDYVRTIDGYIRKVEQVNRKGSYDGLCHGAYNVDIPYKYSQGISAKKIKSHSPNIIDLIEEDDIVKYDSNNSGTDVIEVVVETCKVVEDYDKGEGFICTILDDYIRSKYIKSIITKEQIKQIEYRIKE